MISRLRSKRTATRPRLRKSMRRHEPIVQVFAVALLAVFALALATPGVGAGSSDSFSRTERLRIESLGPWPLDPPTDAGNEFSGLEWAQQLGAKLFFDKRLSGDGSISCASCHLPSLDFSDGLSVGEGVARHVRNTQGLLNAGFQRWFGWDGGADSLWAASLRPMLSDIEMGGDIETIARRLRDDESFTAALREAEIGEQGEKFSDESLVVVAGKIIAAYIRTLVSPATAFDRYRRALLEDDQVGQQAYPADAKRGLKIFLGEANCSVCHFGPNFSNGEFHDTGRPFFTGVGQVDPGRFTGIERVRDDRFNLTGKYSSDPSGKDSRKTTTVTLTQNNFGQWRTPSLRNLVKTAPYMHDGSLKTLREVVDAYADIDPERLHTKGEAILKPLLLTDAERDDLVAFLRSLSAN